MLPDLRSCGYDPGVQDSWDTTARWDCCRSWFHRGTRTGVVQRSQNETVHESEYDGVGADGQSEGEDGGDGDATRPAQLANGESQVGPD